MGRYVSIRITLCVLPDSPSLSSFFSCQALRITQNPPIVTTRYPLQPHIYSWHATCSQCSWFVPTNRVIHLKCSRFVLPCCLIFSHTTVTFFTLLWSRWFFSCQGVDKRWDPGNSGVWWFGGRVDTSESKIKKISQRPLSKHQEPKTKEIPMEIPKRHTLKINPTRILRKGVGGLNVTVKGFLQPIVAFCNNLWSTKFI